MYNKQQHHLKFHFTHFTLFKKPYLHECDETCLDPPPIWSPANQTYLCPTKNCECECAVRHCCLQWSETATVRSSRTVHCAKANGQYGPLDWCIISLIDCFRIVQYAICFCNVFKKSSRANAQVVYRRQRFCSSLHAPLSYNITSTQMLLRTLCVISSRTYFKQIWHFISSADKLHKILIAKNLCKCLCCMRITRWSIKKMWL